MTPPANPTGGTRPTARSRLTGGLAIVVLAAALVANQTAVHWRENVNDSHLFAYFGWRIWQGARPYLDVWDNKPPGIWWANAAGFWACGQDPWGELLICSVALGAALAAYVGAARAVYGPSLTVAAALVGGALLTHLQFECGANRTETFVMACESVAVYGYLRWLATGRAAWLAGGAMAAGAGLIFKQSGVAAAVACGLHLAFRLRRDRTLHRFGRCKPWLIAACAYAAAPLAAVVVLAAQGALREAHFAVFGFNRAYFAIHDATWIHLGRALRVYQPTLDSLYGLLAIVGLGALISGWRLWRRRQDGTRDRAPSGVGLLWLWLACAAYLACVGPGRQSYHLMPALPPLALLALHPLNQLGSGGGLLARMMARPTVAAAVVLYAFVLASLAAESAQVAGRCWATKANWVALRRSPPADYELQGAEVRRLTRSDEGLYVWGWSPGTYRYAQRHCPSRFATIEKVGQVGGFAQFTVDGAIRDILQRPPRAFVISVLDRAAMMQPPQSPFARWLERNYQDHGVVEGMHVCTRRIANGE